MAMINCNCMKSANSNLRLDLLANGTLVVLSDTLITLQLVLFHGN
jgi:hypothetical protein